MPLDMSGRGIVAIALPMMIFLFLMWQILANHPGVSAQPSTLDWMVQQTSGRVTKTTPDYVPILPSSFAQCPSNTQHVVIERAVSTDIIDSGPSLTVSLSIGCCPNSTYGCWDENENRLTGCCAEYVANTPPVCCYNSFRQMFACAQSPAQCCGDRVCAPGYICCGRTCCPIRNATYLNISGACASRQVYNNVTNNTQTVYDGCRTDLSPPLVDFTITQTYNVSCPNGTFSGCPFCEQNQTSCVFPNSSAPFASQQCLAGEAYYYNVTIENCTPLLAGCTDGVSILDFPIGCTNQLSADYCVGFPVGNVPTLVGLKGATDTCCGPFICSQGMRCCSQVINTTDVYGGPLSITKYFGCCQNSTDVQCCYNNIMNSADQRQQLFCGASFNSTACQVDKMRSPGYFALSLSNRGLGTS